MIVLLAEASNERIVFDHQSGSQAESTYTERFGLHCKTLLKDGLSREASGE